MPSKEFNELVGSKILSILHEPDVKEEWQCVKDAEKKDLQRAKNKKVIKIKKTKAKKKVTKKKVKAKGKTKKLPLPELEPEADFLEKPYISTKGNEGIG